MGICLSGGGLRSAAFSLGILQVLQEERQLLQGTRCASYLAAVSGGSYTAGAFMLGARQQAQNDLISGLPPLAEGSPEEKHILTHGRYLVENPIRNGCQLLGLGLLNFVSLVILFVWAGTMLADFAVCRLLVPAPFNLPLQTIDRLPLIILAPALIFAVLVTIRGYYLDESKWRRTFWSPWILGMLLVFATCEPVIEALSRDKTLWSTERMSGAIVFLVSILLIGVAINSVLRHRGVIGPVAVAFNALNFVVPRVLGLVLLAWSTVVAFRFLVPIAGNADHIDERTVIATIVYFFSSLGAGALFSYVPNRASLHREYRRLVESCFSIERNEEMGAAMPVGDKLLSDFKPSQSSKTRFPRLLICATANVHVKIPGGGRQSFVPFVFSHDVCGVPGNAEALFPTEKLELGRAPAGLLTIKKEPLLTLFTAIATTGAAISPSMGRYTVPSARAIFVALNLRLGRWFPNPFSSRLRKAVLAKTVPGQFVRWDLRLGPGYDEMVPEMLGFDGPRVYVSDGGHYDNLGLLALLRARCAEIWCVDAEPDRAGNAHELRRVLAIAKQELNVTADINADAFAAGPDSLYGATHAVGKLVYPDGFEARLIVVKLGLSRDTPANLRQRRETDVRFPHHPTWDQVYNSDRMDAYRQLGRDSALRCSRAVADSNGN